jgi:hypothetical protein
VIEDATIHDLTGADQKLSSFLEILKESYAHKVSVKGFIVN